MKEVKPFYLSTIIFCLFITNISSQTFNFKIPEFNDWTPGKVSCIIQDSKGYYWLGSPEGITRIDATNPKYFGDANGLAQKEVMTIFEDSFGSIWTGHRDGGLSRFNGRNFEEVIIDSIKITGDITNIIEQKDVGIWITTLQQGALLIDLPIKDINHVKARQFAKKDGLADNIIAALITSENDFICGVDLVLYRYNRLLRKFEYLNLPNNTSLFSSNCLMEDRKGNLWIGTVSEGIYKYNMAEQKMEHIALYSDISDYSIKCLSEDHDGKIWVGTESGGLYLIDGLTKNKYNYGNNLKTYNICDILADSEGNIIVADQINGIMVFGKEAYVNITDKHILPSLDVKAIYKDKSGILWFGTDNGISRYDPRDINDTKKFDKEEYLLNQEVVSIKEDYDGNIWFGTVKGFTKYISKLSRFELQSKVNTLLPKDLGFYKMEIDKQNNLWLSTYYGLSIVSINDLSLKNINDFDSIDTKGLPGDLYCDPNGDVWIGSMPVGKKLRRWFSYTLIKYESADNKLKMVADSVGPTLTAITMDREGIVLLGTSDSGLKYLKEGRLIENKNIPEMLKSGRISCIAVSKNNDYFIGSQFGLYIYNPKNNKTVFISKKEGLCDNSINTIHLDENGYAWIGTKNGVSRISTDLNLYLQPAPNPIIRGVEINAKLANLDSISILQYNQNYLVFNLGFSGFNDPMSIFYYVKLEGLGNEWINYGHSSKIIFPPLSPGTYTLKVKNLNSYGIESTKQLSFSFKILPPWWKTKIAYSIYILSLILSLVYIIRVRERKFIRDKILLEKAVKDRTLMIEVQKDEIEAQRDKIADQRDLLKDQMDVIYHQKKNLTDSINYAAKIQSSLIPDESYLNAILSDYFIFFKPRDIVSGDFYWLDYQDSTVIIIGADCTGHGVPGALMSMLGITFLDDIIKTEHVLSPSLILDKLRTRILDAFKQTGGDKEMHDGMDIAVVTLDLNKSLLNYSGAKNPLYLVKNGTLIEFKADKTPISYSRVMAPYTNNIIDIEKGDYIYIFSDGFADQFGGPDNKKFRYSQFRNLLIRLNGEPMKKQKKILETTFYEWKGNHDQVDDVLVIGIRI